MWVIWDKEGFPAVKKVKKPNKCRKKIKGVSRYQQM